MLKVLVIEDEIEIRANLLELLALEGYDILGADNGVTGLIGAMQFEPDLILCDVMMPELDGYDVLAALRQEPKTALIPFIFLTAFADKGDIRQGMKLGADDYLTKPFTCAEVLEAIEARLKKQVLIAEQYENRQSQLIERQRQVQQFRDAIDQEKAALIDDIRKQLKVNVNRLNSANNLLQAMSDSLERDRGVNIIRSVCADEIKLLSRIPNFEYLEADLMVSLQMDDLSQDKLSA